MPNTKKQGWWSGSNGREPLSNKHEALSSTNHSNAKKKKSFLSSTRIFFLKYWGLKPSPSLGLHPEPFASS
jgi:hypothetical protein